MEPDGHDEPFGQVSAAASVGFGLGAGAVGVFLSIGTTTSMSTAVPMATGRGGGGLSVLVFKKGPLSLRVAATECLLTWARSNVGR